MNEITVIGMGAMGSAIASTLVDKRREVCVWNRTTAKTDALKRIGASVADSVDEAIAASPVTILCISNHSDSLELLSTAQSALDGKVLVQLSTCTGTEAEEFANWTAARGADAMTGSIEAYPSAIGTDVAGVALAGSEAAWAACSGIVLDAAPASVYLGDSHALPAALSSALISPLLGMVVGVVHGLLECEKSGFPVSDYVAFLPQALSVATSQAEYLARTIADDDFDDPEAALKTYAAAIAMRAADHRVRGVNDEFLAFLDGLCKRSIDAGHGDQEVSALIKIWR
jgi:3-hydroxyisobutyrate dehydrogenase-like beta-hydroxyacid dehydrogenase